MNKVNIYVEGNEKKFIQLLISTFHLPENISFEIFCTNGKDKIFGNEYPKILSRNTDKQEVNILVFDADNQFVADRKSEILTRIAAVNKALKLNIIINDIFLMPNDENFGCFESLQFEIMNLEHRDKILTCYEKYQTCVSEQNYCPTNIKQKDKAKVYAYLEALDFDSEEIFKPSKTNYLDEGIWQLDTKKLLPLKEFLGKYLNEG